MIVSADVTFFEDQPYFTTQTVPTVPPDDIECVLPTLPPISLPQASSTGFQFADRTYHRRGTAPATVVQPSLDSSVPSSVDVPSSDPNPDPDPPIATRKGTRSCVGRPVDCYTLYSGFSDCLRTHHPITNFMSYDQLSPTFSTFVSSLSSVSMPSSVTEVLAHLGW